MRSELIVPLVAYLALVLVFLLSLYSFHQSTLRAIFCRNIPRKIELIGGFVLVMTITATYISANLFIGGGLDGHGV
ncbi:hypothetical protein [Sodalis-like endosymbiont of Proechinophthirus fluctus]|uniref:hypothetical protein n=1 Tax=Sodalis-like endosymbiont of Proechinophthirus fluctus TaxID=1462730 RepID=UPI00082F29D4